MKLITDYGQWYDDIFDDGSPEFHRMAYTRGGLSKQQQFGLFESLGLDTPPHGTVAELAKALGSQSLGKLRMTAPQQATREIMCVVYRDEFAHRGGGKELLSLDEAQAKYPQHFASLFIPYAAKPLAFRLVRFGQWEFWLRQEGPPGSWQSNLSDRETVMSGAQTEHPNPVPRVVWAIDFVPGPNGLLALDFNTAPDLTTLGETKSLSVNIIRHELERVTRDDPQQLKQF